VAVRDYELTFVLSTTLDEEASAAAVERVNELILSGGGSVTEVHAWGKRRLAYPIAHQRDGLYITTRFSLPGGAVSMLDNDLRLNEHILRHLIVRQEEVPIRPVLPQTQTTGAPASASATAPAELSAEPEETEEPTSDEEQPDMGEEFVSDVEE
jgi:small subunit ribosomal protein S6